MDQQIQIAREVQNAFDNRDPRGAEFVKRVSQKTGLSGREVALMIARTANAHHSMDKPHDFAAMFREAFRRA